MQFTALSCFDAFQIAVSPFHAASPFHACSAMSSGKRGAGSSAGGSKKGRNQVSYKFDPDKVADYLEAAKTTHPSAAKLLDSAANDAVKHNGYANALAQVYKSEQAIASQHTKATTAYV